MALGSNSNYFLCNNGVVLAGVTVTIDITEDIVCAFSFNNHAPQSPVLFRFALHAYSTLTGAAASQRFFFMVNNTATGAAIGSPSPTEPGAVLIAMVETWP